MGAFSILDTILMGKCEEDVQALLVEEQSLPTGQWCSLYTNKDYLQQKWTPYPGLMRSNSANQKYSYTTKGTSMNLIKKKTNIKRKC